MLENFTIVNRISLFCCLIYLPLGGFGQNPCLEDNVGPYINSEASDYTLNCWSPVDWIDVLNGWLADNGGAFSVEAVSWSYEITEYFLDANGIAIRYGFHASDECGNITTTYALFSFFDPADLTLCFGFDPCEACTEVIANGNNPYPVAQGWTCGTPEVDPTPPTILNEAEDYVALCDGNGNLAELNDWLYSNGGSIAIDNCGGISWTWFYEDGSQNTDILLVPGEYPPVTFQVTDVAGNTASTTATFTIEGPCCEDRDACGVCDGPGAIYECGCSDIPDGDCDCEGSQLDALGICGGECTDDVDNDGICDDVDDCVGTLNACGNCSISTAPFECGCIDPDACNYDPDANDNDGSCEYLTCAGCTDAGFLEYDATATVDNGSCLHPLDTLCVSPSVNYWEPYLYDVVQIGGQCWFAENLRSTRFSNGNSIFNSAPSYGDPWYTVYGQDLDYDCSTCTGDELAICSGDGAFELYGRLYNWSAVIDDRNLCPEGWHIPTLQDWETLEASGGYFDDEALLGGYVTSTVYEALGCVGSWWGLQPDDVNGFSQVAHQYSGWSTGQTYSDWFAYPAEIQSVRCIRDADILGCTVDADGDGICDDEDPCVGTVDDCGLCNGPGAIYECGCADIPAGDCDCIGNQLDVLGVCGGGCTADADGDGICDDEDPCVGTVDACGVCNGPGAIYECGCFEIPDGDCDCNGNQTDALGVCGGDCEADANTNGVCDVLDALLCGPGTIFDFATGQCVGIGPACPGDFDDNGGVGISDLLFFLGIYGEVCD